VDHLAELAHWCWGQDSHSAVQVSRVLRKLSNDLFAPHEHECHGEPSIQQSHRIDYLAKPSIPVGQTVVHEFHVVRVRLAWCLVQVRWAVSDDGEVWNTEFLNVKLGDAAVHRGPRREYGARKEPSTPDIIARGRDSPQVV